MISKSTQPPEKLLKNKQRNWKYGPVIFIAFTVVILVFVSKDYFSFLDTQLFQERKSHIVEFTDKAAEIVDSVIEYSWQQVFATEHILKTKKINSKEDLLDTLASTSDFINHENTLVLALDEFGNYYASDSYTGRWPHTEMLTEKAGSRQQVVAEIPHKNGHTYFVFLEHLETPVKIGTEANDVHYLASAIDTGAMQKKISVNGFGNQCYTYLVNQNGRRIYKYTYANNFIEGYNILNTFRDYKIIHGQDYDQFVADLKHDKNTAFEFRFSDEEGRTQNWFVANASLSSVDWYILLFVPTDVLGADSTVLMNRTIEFFIIASAAVVILVATIIIVAMISKADRRLIKQKDEANQLLMVSAEEARSANQAKSDFLSHMSHDIRTPINGIMGMTDIALKNIGNQEKVRDCLNKISGSSHHLLGLINDVLDMSRIESGKTKVNHDSFDLRTCIDNCASIVGGQLTTRDVELVKEIDSFEHPLLIGDELHLRQVFINILGNSVKFTPDGGKIYFRAKEIESADGKAFFRFELEDTGMGMKAEFLPHLFDAFSQEDDGTRTTYKGTGLGMAITKKFLDLMHASVEVTSKLAVGTKFAIELWIDIDEHAIQHENPADYHIDLSGMKVLLVEDIELNLEIAQSILEEEGVITTPALNGQEAVDAFAQHPEGTFDAILMDIMMPVMDGITAAKTIRAMQRPDAAAIPILAMTANAYEDDIKKTHEAGMNAHLSKPIDTDTLLKTLAHYFHPQKTETETLAGLKILAADDVELNLEIAREILQAEGMIVTTSANGQEAVDAFAQNPEGTFDVILMDVHMPVMDGITAAKAIRAMQRSDALTIPILAMTADVYDEDMKKTKEAGMNGHLTKPLDIDQIKQALYTVIEFSDADK